MSSRLASSGLAVAFVLLAVAGCLQPIGENPDAGADGGSSGIVPGRDGSTSTGDAGDAGGDGGAALDGGGTEADGGRDGGGRDACTPKTCAESGACGVVDDGCGGTLQCTCTLGLTCSGADAGSRSCGCANTAFQARVADTGAGYTGLYNAIARDAAGGLHVAYVDGDNGFKYLYQPLRSGSFAPVIEPVDTSAPVTGTAIAVGPDGAVHVAYYRWGRVSNTIWDAEAWYARRAPGGGWTKTRVSMAGQMVYVRADYTAIALSAGGTVHLLYYSFTYQTADLWHASSETGTGWITELVAEGAEVGSQWTSAGTVPLVIDGAGTLHALYFDYATVALKYASRPTGGSWSVDPVPVAAPRTTDEWAGAYASLVVDSDGRLQALYSRDQVSAISLWHATRAANGQWSGAQLDPVAGADKVGFYNALAADAAGGLHAAYYDSTNQNLKYAYRPAGGSWRPEAAVTEGSVGAHAAIAVDPAGTVHVAYFELVDQTNGKGQLRYATRCR